MSYIKNTASLNRLVDKLVPKETIKLKHRQKILNELSKDMINHFAKDEMANGLYLEVSDFIRNWNPKGD